MNSSWRYNCRGNWQVAQLTEAASAVVQAIIILYIMFKCTWLMCPDIATFTHRPRFILFQYHWGRHIQHGIYGMEFYQWKAEQHVQFSIKICKSVCHSNHQALHCTWIRIRLFASFRWHARVSWAAFSLRASTPGWTASHLCVLTPVKSPQLPGTTYSMRLMTDCW